jgi:hypothetical protein
MDLFSLQNVHNLELSYTKRLGRGVQVRAIWNGFWLAEQNTDAWYNAGSVPIRIATTDVDPYVGNELDILVWAPLFSGRVGLLAGVSVFFAGSYLEDFDLVKDAYFFQREVAGVEQVEIQIIGISLVGMRTFSRKNVVVFTPNNECWGLMFAEIGLPAGIQRNIALIVIKERELNCRITLATKMPMIYVPVVRADRL